MMHTLKTTAFLYLAGIAAAGAQTPAAHDFSPQTGQPAADVVGSHDLWGNPTFLGGITNTGPDSTSVW